MKIPRDASSSSMPRIFSRFLMASWAFRAAQGAMDTWSSWLAFVGMLSHTEGKHSVLFSEARAEVEQQMIL